MCGSDICINLTVSADWPEAFIPRNTKKILRNRYLEYIKPEIAVSMVNYIGKKYKI